MTKQTAYLLATWFKSGLSPKAPGTVGSLCTLPLAWILATYTGTIGILIASIIIFIIGEKATKIVLSDKENGQDPGFVVIDEVVGQLLSFVFIAHLHINIYMYLFGFAFFRFFDILKPWPVSHYDKKVHSAYGVMMDDVCAGLYAGLMVLATQYIVFGL